MYLLIIINCSLLGDGDVHCWDKNTIKKIGMPTRTKSIACGEHFYISLGGMLFNYDYFNCDYFNETELEDSRVYTWTLSNDTVIPIVSLFPSQTGSKVIQIGAGMDGFGAALTGTIPFFISSFLSTNTKSDE